MSNGRTILGVHIEDQFLNLVGLRRTDKGLSVCASAAVPLDEGMVQHGRIVSGNAVGQKINAFCRANKLKASEMVMSPSCEAVVLKASEYVSKSEAQTKQQVAEQVNKYTLFGNEEVIFDHCTLDTDDPVSGRRTVLEAITTQQVSESFINVAQKTRLKLKTIEPAPLPLVKLIYGGLSEETRGISLLLALESNTGTICVFENTVPRLCQNLNIGTGAFSEKEAGTEQLISKLKTVLEYARSLSSFNASGIVMRVAASGSRETMRNMAAMLDQKLSGITVQAVDPTAFGEGFNVDAGGTEEVPVFAFAQALAAFDVTSFSGQLNLVSQKTLVACKARREMSLTAKGLVAIVLLAVLARAPFKMEMSNVEAASEEIQQRNDGVMTFEEKIMFVKRQNDKLEKKQAVYEQAYESLAPVPWGRVLESIAAYLPQTVRVTGIQSAKEEQFRIQGEAWTENEIRTFQKSLANSALFKTAKIESINYKEKDGFVVVTYELVCQAQFEETNLL